jgi:YidC/Oxa1 family membrane protein insertase
MKKQQETMKLYNKAGVNPMAGCLGYCKCQYFMLYFSSFLRLSLRQKDFYGQMIYLHSIQFMNYHFIFPAYGSHIVCSQYASIAIFFYMKMTTGDQQMQAHRGMPDMAKMMKIMVYISPLMMLLFFNSYASV